MIHNFESWRQAKQAAFVDNFHDMHYHRCSDTTYRLVSSLLQHLLSAWVKSYHAPVSVRFSQEQAELMFAFLDQMQLAYIHPRSSSHRFLMALEYSPSATPSTY
jgi:hypothetical protein